MNPISTRAAKAAGFDEKVPHVACEVTEVSVGAAYDAVAGAYAERFGPVDDTERWVVDLGCGPGRIAVHLARAGNRVVGVDASAEMIRIARGRAPELEFRVGDMAPFLAARPDAVGNALLWYSARRRRVRRAAPRPARTGAAGAGARGLRAGARTAAA